MPFYVADYLAATMHLSTVQHGAYLLLLIHGWKSDGHIPGDELQLSAIAKLTLSDWQANAKLLLSFWDRCEDGTYTQSRLLKEVERAKRVSKSRSELGRMGAIAKANAKQTLSNSLAIGSAKPQQNVTQSQSQSPEDIDKGNFPEVPPMSREKFDRMAEMRAIPKDCADWFWNDCEGRAWHDKSGQPIRRVEPLLLNCAKTWRANAHKYAQAGQAPEGPEVRRKPSLRDVA